MITIDQARLTFSVYNQTGVSLKPQFDLALVVGGEFLLLLLFLLCFLFGFLFPLVKGMSLTIYLLVAIYVLVVGA